MIKLWRDVRGNNLPVTGNKNILRWCETLMFRTPTQGHLTFFFIYNAFSVAVKWLNYLYVGLLLVTTPIRSKHWKEQGLHGKVDMQLTQWVHPISLITTLLLKPGGILPFCRLSQCSYCSEDTEKTESCSEKHTLWASQLFDVAADHITLLSKWRQTADHTRVWADWASL